MRTFSRTSLLATTALALLSLAPACAVDDDEDLGSVVDGKGDLVEINRDVQLKKRLSSTKPSTKTYTVTSDVDFKVSLTYSGSAETEIWVQNYETGDIIKSGKAVQPALDIDAAAGETVYKIRLKNWNASALSVHLNVKGSKADTGVTPELLAAAQANLKRIAKEIDYNHLETYGLSGSLDSQFMKALELEYKDDEPEQYAARVKAVASLIFFAAPDILPPAGGKLTPFHGLDEQGFEALMAIEDEIFSYHMGVAGGSAGVRPFSVCETRYMVEKYVREGKQYGDFDSYKAGFVAYAAGCAKADIEEWYNFRGLGGLRPSWVESNIMDRFLRRMNGKCAGTPAPEWTAECAKWNADRLDYRLKGNRQLAGRQMFYDPATQESYLTNPQNMVALLEDRNGDGVGEMLQPGPAKLKTGEDIEIIIESTGQFTGSLKMRKGGVVSSLKPQDVVADDRVHPMFDSQLLDTRDMGLLALFPDGSNCTADTLDENACPLLKRFYSMIDRHEYFYNTYSALSPDRSNISSQPSPLVACSITLEAAHAWDTAGTPPGGTAGFIFLMRIPFKQILVGSTKNVSTLEPAPEVLSIQSIYNANGDLDMSKVWLDIATLSNNQYESEHEISKFGNVPAEQIEGILVIRKPAAMP